LINSDPIEKMDNIGTALIVSLIKNINMKTEQQEAKLREKVKLLLFNYPTQWNRIIKRFVKCLNNEKKI
jgi:hypothetical protein